MSHNEDIESEPLLITEPHPPSPRQGQWVVFPLLAVLLFSAAVIFATVSFLAVCRSHTRIQSEIQHFWGAYTPYFPVKPYVPPPPHCQITQVRWLLFGLFFSSLTSEKANIVGVPSKSLIN